MDIKNVRRWFAGITAVLALFAGPASAALTEFQTFVGTVGYSSDGFGSLSQSGTISANVPAGSTVVAAYLYTTTFRNPTNAGVGGTLGGTAVTYAVSGVVGDDCCNLASLRADVTAIVKPIIDGGAGGIYNFSITETSASQDGEALIVVYNLPSLPIATVGILDGASATAGDTSSINFADPLNPAAPGFFAEMALGIGFSCCGQQSNITVNGTTITQSAGNNDDGDQVADGALITVGGFNDPFSALLPSYADDRERYNLVAQITAGDTSIVVDTANPSRNDNIFVQVFHVFGRAGINEPPPPPNGVPEPGTLALLALGLTALGLRRKSALH